jgi:hypothetical protein
MIDLLLFLYVSILSLSFLASRKEKTFLPLFIGSVCCLLRAVLGYTVPAAAAIFSSTGISALAVMCIVTMLLEFLMLRNGAKLLFYLTYYLGVSLTSLLAESYGMLSNFWNNAEIGFFGLPWRGIFAYYFFTFFAVLKLGELIYFFAFKKLFNEFYVMDS